MATSTLDLSVFLADEPTRRYDMTVPHVIDRWQYYTNGKICVRVPCGLPDTDKEKRPGFDGIMPMFDFSDTKTVHFEAPTTKSCKRCKGLGSVRQLECSDCDGTGIVTTFSDYGIEYENECRHCGETGYLECPDESAKICPSCHGTKHSNDESVDIDGYPFDPVLVQLVLNLNPTETNLLEKARDTPYSQDRYAILGFKFDGGEGVLMGRTK